MKLDQSNHHSYHLTILFNQNYVHKTADLTRCRCRIHHGWWPSRRGLRASQDIKELGLSKCQLGLRKLSHQKLNLKLYELNSCYSFLNLKVCDQLYPLHVGRLCGSIHLRMFYFYFLYLMKYNRHEFTPFIYL